MTKERVVSTCMGLWKPICYSGINRLPSVFVVLSQLSHFKIART